MDRSSLQLKNKKTSAEMGLLFERAGDENRTPIEHKVVDGNYGTGCQERKEIRE